MDKSVKEAVALHWLDMKRAGAHVAEIDLRYQALEAILEGMSLPSEARKALVLLKRAINTAHLETGNI